MPAKPPPKKRSAPVIVPEPDDDCELICAAARRMKSEVEALRARPPTTAGQHIFEFLSWRSDFQAGEFDVFGVVSDAARTAGLSDEVYRNIRSAFCSVCSLYIAPEQPHTACLTREDAEAAYKVAQSAPLDVYGLNVLVGRRYWSLRQLFAGNMEAGTVFSMPCGSHLVSHGSPYVIGRHCNSCKECPRKLRLVHLASQTTTAAAAVFEGETSLNASTIAAPLRRKPATAATSTSLPTGVGAGGGGGFSPEPLETLG